MYWKVKQAAQMSGATKDAVLENALSRYLAELQEDAEDAALARGQALKFKPYRSIALPCGQLAHFVPYP